MKSNNEKLKNRGFIQQEDLQNIINKTNEEIFKLLVDKDPCRRTAAVKVLSERLINDSSYCDKLLDMLQKEKALYTKIEICQSLQNGSNFCRRPSSIHYRRYSSCLQHSPGRRTTFTCT